MSHSLPQLRLMDRGLTRRRLAMGELMMAAVQGLIPIIVKGNSKPLSDMFEKFHQEL